MTSQTPGDRLCEARTDAGFTQQKVADKVGIQVSSICRYEKKQMPGLVRGAELAEAVGVRTHWLATGKGRRKL